MEIVAYRELLKGLEEIEAWLGETGFRQRSNRVGLYRRNIALLSSAFDEGKLDWFFGGATDDRRRELMWSLAESIEFVDSIAALRSRGCQIPVRVLEAALDGPADPLSESEKSNRGRNTMFEIAVAGRFARAGLSPLLGNEPDVYVEFKNRKIFIQCKRVFSEAGIAKRLIEAGKQLKRDLASSLDPRDCGIIAISLTRVFNKGDRLLVMSDEDALRRKLHDEIDAIRACCLDQYRHITEPKIAGVYYHLSTPAFLEKAGLYIGVHSVTVATIPGKSDRALLEALGKSLATQ